MMTNATDWLTASQVMDELSIGRHRLDEWLQMADPFPARRLPGGKHWRVYRSDMNEWLFKNCTPLEWVDN